jgi:hypothetical protein
MARYCAIPLAGCVLYSMVRPFSPRRHGGRIAAEGPVAHRLTKRQWAIIAQITAKIETPMVDASDQTPEDLETAPEDTEVVEDIDPDEAPSNTLWPAPQQIGSW